MVTKTPIVGTIGLKIKIDADFDISTADPLQLHYCKPDGTLGSFNAVYELDSGKHYAVYVTTSGSDIDQEGKWTFQIYVEMGANTFWGTAVRTERFRNKL